MAWKTTGFVNALGQGVGIEYSFHKVLRGVADNALYEKLAGGNWKMLKHSHTNKPVDGYDVETTLDINLQNVAHKSLLKILLASQATYSCIIVMKMATGEIKAMVNLGKNEYRRVYISL